MHRDQLPSFSQALDSVLKNCKLRGRVGMFQTELGRMWREKGEELAFMKEILKVVQEGLAKRNSEHINLDSQINVLKKERM